MRYFRDSKGEVFAYDKEDQSELADDALKKGMVEITGKWPVKPPASELKALEREQKLAEAMPKTDAVILAVLEQFKSMAKSGTNITKDLSDVIKQCDKAQAIK